MKTAETEGDVPSMSMRAGVVKDEIKRMTDQYVGRIEVQLVQWGKDLDELIVRPDRAASAISRPSISDLESSYRAAQFNLAAWRALGGVKWGTYRYPVEQAWNNLEGAFVALRMGFAARGALPSDIPSASGVDG